MASVITHLTLSGGALGPLAGHELLAPESGALGTADNVSYVYAVGTTA
jgi:hypothetical protein